jgi:hypothetical protein
MVRHQNGVSLTKDIMNAIYDIRRTFDLIKHNPDYDNDQETKDRIGQTVVAHSQVDIDIQTGHIELRCLLLLPADEEKFE